MRQALIFGQELRYLAEVLVLGYLAVIVVAWVINQVFVPEGQKAPLQQLTFLFFQILSIGAVRVPTVFLVALSVFMFLRVRHFKVVDRAKFWRWVSILIALASPFAIALFLGWRTNWQFEFSGHQRAGRFYEEFFWTGFSFCLLLVCLVLGWGLRAAVVKLFSVIRGRPAIEESTSN